MDGSDTQVVLPPMLPLPVSPSPMPPVVPSATTSGSNKMPPPPPAVPPMPKRPAPSPKSVVKDVDEDASRDVVTQDDGFGRGKDPVPPPKSVVNFDASMDVVKDDNFWHGKDPWAPENQPVADQGTTKDETQKPQNSRWTRRFR